MPSKILVVDDEPKIVAMLRKFLQAEGFSVVFAYDGEEALEVFRKEKPDLVVLDVMLPGIDGLEVLKIIRKEKEDMPIIMLTARSEEVDRVLGLGLGADDYVTKPFSFRELVLRIKAILRRAGCPSKDTAKTLSVGGLSINSETMEVFVEGEPKRLTPTEFGILKTLLSRPGKVFTREELLDALGDSYEGYERSVDTHVWSLRRKIEKDPSNPMYVITVFGVGYKGGGETR